VRGFHEFNLTLFDINILPCIELSIWRSIYSNKLS